MIIVFYLSKAPAQRTKFSFDQCPKFASHFSLLYTTMTGQINNISSLLLGPETLVPLGLPCLYKKFGLVNKLIYILLRK